MKIRTGFVSNSSSSSFVIITTPEKWQAACRQLAEQIGENMAFVVISEYGKGKKATILGQEALVFSGIQSTEEFGSTGVCELEEQKKITEEESEQLSMDAYEHIGELEDILNKDGVSYTSSECC